MARSTTALLRRIEDEAEAKRQAAWAERKASGSTGRERQRPRWCVDHLLSVGQITAEQHEAGRRYASVLERSMPGGAGSDAKVDCSNAGADPHARMWDAAVSAETARAARLFVLRTKSASRNRMQTLDKVFAFPQPTMSVMQRSPSGSKLPYDYACRRIRHVLELLDVFWADVDRGYGPQINLGPSR